MTRFIHHDVREVHVIVRDADGAEIPRRHRATGFIGDPALYERFTNGLRSKLGEGEWLDTSEADAEHGRVMGIRDECIQAVHGA